MKHWIQLAGLSAIAVLFCATQSFAQAQPAGFVRISDKPAVGQEMQAEAQQAGQPVHTQGNCNSDGSGQYCQDCEECRGVPCLFPCFLGFFGCHRHDCQNSHCDPYQPHCYVDANGKVVCEEADGFRVMRRKAACRYGYFRPQGNCGKGLSVFGKYQHVYSLNPDYMDPRDGQLYAAQGYGVNISVPLAPTVGSVYNYGWGVPSSRQTFVNHRIPLQVGAPQVLDGSNVPVQNP